MGKVGPFGNIPPELLKVIKETPDKEKFDKSNEDLKGLTRWEKMLVQKSGFTVEQAKTATVLMLRTIMSDMKKEMDKLGKSIKKMFKEEK